MGIDLLSEALWCVVYYRPRVLAHTAPLQLNTVRKIMTILPENDNRSKKRERKKKKDVYSTS